ncbi:hypothetical protein M011DRAFT_523785 [Sporormia fimetaria CBS 119925]|uniref:Uncharacterized protein n=1 Tax=Sporormia fimetaria CBS 119925 TaxID=1340428 RepID=A0A6A6VL29_9PLEO|nr:hypothetical protein M011DRAFT_523785 [Sporormia fimetaria CBS 119925]
MLLTFDISSTIMLAILTPLLLSLCCLLAPSLAHPTASLDTPFLELANITLSSADHVPDSPQTAGYFNDCGVVDFLNFKDPKYDKNDRQATTWENPNQCKELRKGMKVYENYDTCVCDFYHGSRCGGPGEFAFQANIAWHSHGVSARPPIKSYKCYKRRQGFPDDFY